ncbi:hypothetical protein NW110_04680 [Staphylococcus pettenkoferi]|uniref:hypothetical protein n=1 Tax=Staphylococcus pettenkoferi TaxID=170573 RepID=UPI001559C166|nr:hypothetical protein [Staphylococcus pettenkoferi]MCY1570499.1 hypothetical protein [Staphylococcus pettenkoferi]MCY1590328.1 hypothetical protein [Staphylococcus pettenkoferi]MCY1598656.1 hypothetical protein [Staphylococcus pettenkoferi]MCY1601224.1 hypothetical protein [Staphylococcus pettenkoferi]MCY1608598.1 hypothetical protein [Staphylococcus pettenkoferi]
MSATNYSELTCPLTCTIAVLLISNVTALLISNVAALLTIKSHLTELLIYN